LRSKKLPGNAVHFGFTVLIILEEEGNALDMIERSGEGPKIRKKTHAVKAGCKGVWGVEQKRERRMGGEGRRKLGVGKRNAQTGGWRGRKNEGESASSHQKILKLRSAEKKRMNKAKKQRGGWDESDSKKKKQNEELLIKRSLSRNWPKRDKK